MDGKNDFTITRVFDAPRDLVWQVHTEEQHLAKWWGPKELEMVSAKLDLRPGGMFHYAMKAPDGQTMWGKFAYKEIVPKEKIVFVNSFSDEQGNTTRHPVFGGDKWPLETLNTLTLTEQDGKTTLTIKGHPINATEEEINLFNSMFESMNQGFKGTFDQLEEYLKSVKNVSRG